MGLFDFTRQAAEIEREARGRQAPISSAYQEPDPEGAIEDMRLARSYLDDWYKEKGGGQHLLSFASKYLEQATAKDPSAKLLTEDKKGEPIALTIDDLAGEVLFCQSTYYTFEGAEKKALLKGRDLLRKAIEYAPYSIYYRSRLADVFLNLHDKQSALAVAREAVQVNPKNLDARKLLDRIEAAPITSPPSPISGSTAFMLIGGGLVIIALINLFNGYFSNFFTLVIFALIAIGIGRFLEGDQMLKKAVEEQDRKRAGR